MATKKATKKRSAPSASSDTKVTRIKATDSAPKTKRPTATVASKKSTINGTAKAPKIIKAKKPKTDNVWRRSLGYFTGAWYELKQVHWPDRKSSWGMTIALIVFSLIFVGIILLLDALFQYLFGLAIGK